MFRISIIVGLFLAVIIITVDFFLTRKKSPRTYISPKGNRWIRLLTILSYLAAGLFFILTAISAFFHRLIFGQAMTGYLMVLHLIVGMVFFTATVAAVLLTANRHVFTIDDCEKAVRLPDKICFWGIFVAALTMSAAILLCMMRIFNSEIHKILVTIHQYCAIILTILVIYYAYRRLRMKLSSAKDAKAT